MALGHRMMNSRHTHYFNGKLMLRATFTARNAGNKYILMKKPNRGTLSVFTLESPYAADGLLYDVCVM